MGMRLRILGSSSQGNSALLEWNGGKALIDAGFSGRRLCSMLKACDTSIEEIDAVFVTHEHTDHAKGLYGLSRYNHLKVFANERTARASSATLPRKMDWQLFATGSRFQFRDLTVNAFAVPHDAHDPVGFSFSVGQEGDLFDPPANVVWLTDLGYVPDRARHFVESADIVVLEANHDEALLEADEHRPWSVKQRIRGRHGHLSNADAHRLVSSFERPRWRHLLLGHLSRDCNNPAQVASLFENSSANNPAAQYSVQVINPAQELAAVTAEI